MTDYTPKFFYISSTAFSDPVAALNYAFSYITEINLQLFFISTVNSIIYRLKKIIIFLRIIPYFLTRFK